MATKILSWFVGLFLLLSGCKREEPQPGSTEINLLVIDETRKPLPAIEVLVSGSSGSYFGGARGDTVFAQPFTNVNGLMTYKALIERKWRVYTIPIGFYDANGHQIYDLARFEGTSGGFVNVGEVNNITAVLKRR